MVMPTGPADPADPAAQGRLPEQHGRLTTLPDPRLPSWGPRRRARIVAFVFWGNLICQMAIILSGGAVRLTGSGLGCSTWPHCEPGNFTPELTMEAGIHPFVEFGNRTLTGVLGVFAIALLVISWRWLGHKGRSFRWLSLVPLIGTGLQGLIGAFVVWLHLHPGLVSPHFLISPVLVAVSTVLLVRAYEGNWPLRLAAPRPLLLVFAFMAAAGFSVLVLGTLVTGTGPHSGDAGDIARIAFDPVVISRIHAMAVFVFCALLVTILVVLHRLPGRHQALPASWTLLAITVAQGMIGYVQYFTGLPGLVVFFHLVGSACFAAGITWVGTRLVTWQAPVADREPAAEWPVTDSTHSAGAGR